MTLTYGLDSAKDLLEKLRRDSALLNDEVTSDRFFNFVVTGYSLIDWVKNDPTMPGSVKSDASSLYADIWLQVCGDLAIASKHFTLTTRNPVTENASSKRGWGHGRWGKGGWGCGEETIEITLNDGRIYSGLEFVSGVLQTWERFFWTHGM